MISISELESKILAHFFPFLFDEAETDGDPRTEGETKMEGDGDGVRAFLFPFEEGGFSMSP